jgi:hypothetical protein
LKVDQVNEIVHTNGGRYDCDVKNRVRHPVYWSEPSCTIRRGTWYYKKESYIRFVPYPEGQYLYFVIIYLKIGK